MLMILSGIKYHEAGGMYCAQRVSMKKPKRTMCTTNLKRSIQCLGMIGTNMHPKLNWLSTRLLTAWFRVRVSEGAFLFLRS